MSLLLVITVPPQLLHLFCVLVLTAPPYWKLEFSVFLCRLGSCEDCSFEVPGSWVIVIGPCK